MSWKNLTTNNNKSSQVLKVNTLEINDIIEVPYSTQTFVNFQENSTFSTSGICGVVFFNNFPDLDGGESVQFVMLNNDVKIQSVVLCTPFAANTDEEKRFIVGITGSAPGAIIGYITNTSSEDSTSDAFGFSFFIISGEPVS